MVFRKDLCALRGLAVIVIVLFHLGAGFEGGFVGVDVFFVLSGYLIARGILDSIDSDSFSIRSFLRRKFVRLMPSLLLIMFCTWVFSLFILSAEHLLRLQQSMLAAAFFVSNFYFYGVSGYFDTSALGKPLLHTWALGIEAQFYVLAACMFFLLRNRHRKLHMAVWSLIALVSFTSSCFLSLRDPSAAYFLPQARLWPLAAGVLLALSNKTVNTSDFTRDALRCMTLSIIGWCAWSYGADISYPGFSTLPICFATLTFIGAGAGNGASFTDKILSNPVLQILGKSSYGIYLWHWPVLTLLRLSLIRTLTGFELLAIFATCIAMGILSAHLLERRFVSRIDRFLLLAVALFTALTLLKLDFSSERKSSNENNFASDRHGIASVKAGDAAPGKTEKQAKHPTVDDFVTLLHQEPVAPTFALWGDSFARMLLPAFAVSAKDLHSNGYVIVRDGCPALIGIWKHEWDVDCPVISSQVLSFLLKKNIRRVYLSSRWTLNSLGVYEDSIESKEFHPLYDAESDKAAVGTARDKEKKATFLRSLERTIRLLTENDIEVFIFDQPAEQKWNFAMLQDFSDWPEEKKRERYPSRAETESRQYFVTEALALLEMKYPIRVLRVRDLLCVDEWCPAIRQGQMLYADEKHLSATGSMLLEPIIRKSFVDY